MKSEGWMSMRQERMLGVALLAVGLTIAAVAVTRMGTGGVVHAQVAQTPPAAAAQDDKPAESMPGGTRPTTPAPEPARPTTGTSPSSSGDRAPMLGTPLPPAPAEKTGEPLQRK